MLFHIPLLAEEVFKPFCCNYYKVTTIETFISNLKHKVFIISKTNLNKMKLEQDLHTHTTYSDGSWGPRRRVREAVKLGIKRLAITDHDSVGGVEKSQDEAKEYDITIIPGIELFSEHDHDGLVFENTEVLGYNFDIDKMKEYTSKAQKNRLKKIYAYMKQLNRIYEEGSVEEANKQITEMAKGNPTILACRLREEVNNPINMKNLLENRLEIELKDENVKYIKDNTTFVTFDVVSYMLKHYIQDPKEIDRARREKNKGYDIGDVHVKKIGLILKEIYKDAIFKSAEIPTERNQEEAIKTILECGGIPVLAHPAIKNEKVMEKPWLGEHNPEKVHPRDWIERLVSYGLKGIELYYYFGNGGTEYLSINANKYFYKLAKDYDLIVTYGTDCHGPKKDREPTMGKYLETDPLSEIILKLDFTKI